MKKGISWQTLPNHFSYEKKLKLAFESGFSGVEIIGGMSKEDLQNIGSIANQLNLEITSILNSQNWKFPLSSNDKEVRKISRNSIIQDLRDASFIGAKTVLCVPGVVNESISYKDAYKNSFEEIKYIAEYANKYNVNIGIENVWNKFLLSQTEFINFIDQINCTYVKAYFDIGNICLYGYPHDWILSLKKKRISGIHVKGFLDYPNNIEFPKTLISDVPWKSTMKALKKIGYNDYLTVEIKNSKDKIETVEKVYQYSIELEKIIKGNL